MNEQEQSSVVEALYAREAKVFRRGVMCGVVLWVIPNFIVWMVSP